MRRNPWPQLASPRAHGERDIEIENEGIFDELVVDHWQQMDERAWWMRVGDVDLSVTMEPDGSVTVHVQRGDHEVAT